MERVERIQEMERKLDAAADAVRTLSDALERYRAVQTDLNDLAAYYDGGEWLADYDADCAGELPPELKRGVLSQDGLYDLLTQHQDLLTTMGQLSAGGEEQKGTRHGHP